MYVRFGPMLVGFVFNFEILKNKTHECLGFLFALFVFDFEDLAFENRIMRRHEKTRKDTKDNSRHTR